MQRAITAPMLSRRATANPLTALLVAAIAGCTAGCQLSLPYAPRPSPRVQIVERRLAKDGQLHDMSHLGELVQGNQAAETEARAYATSDTVASVLNTMGFFTDLGGAGILVGGASAKDTTAVGFGLALALLGADFFLFGNIASNRAHDHVTNAVNRYNDDLPPEALVPKVPGAAP
jgi:hypothetical protein